MKRLLLYLWQLPQNLLGLLLAAIYAPERKHIMDNGNVIYFSNRMQGGISLGKYSIVNTCHYRKELSECLKRDTVRHEAIGHAKQSLYLGPFYLLVVGLPSIVWAAICKDNKRYFKVYPENWADRLANVKR